MARGECEAQMSERDSLAELADPMVNTVHCQHLRSRNVNMGENEPQTPPLNPRAADGALRSLWFTGPMGDEDRRQPLTRERVLAQALTIIAKEGVEALTMRNLAACLGVVPGALYRHVRSKEQLQDLVLDGVLAEVDCDVDPSLPCTEQIKVLAHRLRAVLEDHPGIAALLKIRDPLGPHSLALAEAFFLVIDYTVGFAVSSPRISVNEQRVRDTATRKRLHEFFRSLPADRFPTLVALGEHVWLDNRDERFAAGLEVLADGLQRARPAPRRRNLSAGA